MRGMSMGTISMMMGTLMVRASTSLRKTMMAVALNMARKTLPLWCRASR